MGLSATLIDNQRLHTIEDLSKFLSVPESTIRDWIYKRQIPFRKLGRLIRFHPLDIQKWLNERSHYGNQGD
ncbi:MAG: helix-turn-helix domain-containing protein [Deltaproteobacteria bacterium]|nr:helix-turn-helix domain-containing protein [Deltaproteobacteria bacterium]